MKMLKYYVMMCWPGHFFFMQSWDFLESPVTKMNSEKEYLFGLRMNQHNGIESTRRHISSRIFDIFRSNISFANLLHVTYCMYISELNSFSLELGFKV